MADECSTWEDVIRGVSNDRVLLNVLLKEARRSHVLAPRDVNSTAAEAWSNTVQKVVSAAFTADGVVRVLNEKMRSCEMSTGGAAAVKAPSDVVATAPTAVAAAMENLAPVFGCETAEPRARTTVGGAVPEASAPAENEDSGDGHGHDDGDEIVGNGRIEQKQRPMCSAKNRTLSACSTETEQSGGISREIDKCMVSADMATPANDFPAHHPPSVPPIFLEKEPGNGYVVATQEPNSPRYVSQPRDARRAVGDVCSFDLTSGARQRPCGREEADRGTPPRHAEGLQPFGVDSPQSFGVLRSGRRLLNQTQAGSEVAANLPHATLGDRPTDSNLAVRNGMPNVCDDDVAIMSDGKAGELLCAGRLVEEYAVAAGCDPVPAASIPIPISILAGKNGGGNIKDAIVGGTEPPQAPINECGIGQDCTTTSANVLTNPTHMDLENQRVGPGEVMTDVRMQSSERDAELALGALVPVSESRVEATTHTTQEGEAMDTTIEVDTNGEPTGLSVVLKEMKNITRYTTATGGVTADMSVGCRGLDSRPGPTAVLLYQKGPRTRDEGNDSGSEDYACDDFEPITSNEKNVRFLDDAVLCSVHEVRASFQPHELGDLFYSAADMDRMYDEMEREEACEQIHGEVAGERDDGGSLILKGGTEADLGAVGGESVEEISFESYSFDGDDSEDFF